MGYLSKGYYTICLGSILSSILFMILFGIVFFLEKELGQAVSLGMNVSIIGIEACGVVLCVMGYRRHETVESLTEIKREDPYSYNLRLSIPLTAFLFLWGGFIVYVISQYVAFSTPYEKLALMRNTLQFASYVTWTLKGTIGLISGLIFTLKSLLRQHKELGTRINRKEPQF